MNNDPLIVHLSSQCAIFLRACLCGAALALVFDFFRIIRRVFRCPVVLVAIQDLFCCAVFCLGSFLFLLSQCDGRLRWFALAGQLLGAVLYWSLLGGFIVRGGAWLLSLLIRGLGLVWGLLLRVTRLLRGLLGRLLRLFAGLFSWPVRQIRAAGLQAGQSVQKILKKGLRKTKFCLKPYHILLYNSRKAKAGGRSLPKDHKSGRG